MSKWRKTVKLVHFWNNVERFEDVDIDGLRDAILADPDLSDWYDNEAYPLSDIEDTADFDSWLDTLYDFANSRNIWIPPY